ncbi:hypothetical protein DKX38_024202 [Salix brachista]|uniref:Membrane-associated 30 kDa protein, chloroplastic n=1 Tax=Salix brachista TaxID=2182728 RepID=A0A5N5JRA7_9ROSI|nr:hypothetical protein DKX38_024202 [Salix brachista]
MAIKSQLITGLTLSMPRPPSTSSSSNNKVEALKVARVRTSLSTRSNCYRQGGGALGTCMNLFDRFGRVVKSYANAIVSSFEDPEKILEQTVLEMNGDLTKMRQATAQVLASQKRLENKYNAAQLASEEWYRKAQLALQKGEEGLAREALKRRKTYADNANSFKAQLDQQKGVVENLVSNTRLLESKMQEAKSKKDTLKARAQSAKLSLPPVLLSKTTTKMNEMLGNVNTSNALAAFDKMEEKEMMIALAHLDALLITGLLHSMDYRLPLTVSKSSFIYIYIYIYIVLAMESEAEALGQLTTNELDGKLRYAYDLWYNSSMFALLEGSSVDDDLENLKKELAGSSKKGELPPGRTVVSSSKNSFRDLDIERELNELRQKRENF